MAPSQIPNLSAILVVLMALPSVRKRVYQSLTTCSEGALPVRQYSTLRIKLYSARITKKYWNTLTAFLQQKIGVSRSLRVSVATERLCNQVRIESGSKLKSNSMQCLVFNEFDLLRSSFSDSSQPTSLSFVHLLLLTKMNRCPSTS